MAKQFSNKGGRIWGMDKQKLIQRFFGGNASISIIVLALICLFLAREAVLFFPQHHADLKLYRESGQEYVGYVIKETEEYTKLVSWCNQAYYQELDASFGIQRGLLEAYEAIAEKLSEEGEALIDDLWNVDEELKAAKEQASEDSPQAELAIYQRKFESAKEAWIAYADGVLAGLDKDEIDSYQRLDSAQWQSLLIALRAWDPLTEEPPALITKAEKEMDVGMEAFSQGRGELISAGHKLKKLRDKLTKVASKTYHEALAEKSALARKKALLKGAEKAETPEQAAELQKQASGITIRESFPFQERTEPIREAHREHISAVEELREKLHIAIGKLPVNLKDETSQELVERIKKRKKGFLKKLDRSLQQSAKWDYEKPISPWSSVTKFFFGRNWITNSSWHDFYGLLPLFAGSFIISLIALVVAVPFSICAAIYINRLSTQWEQNTIKPSIEFIQAIPSVVLGFLGIFILGDGLRALSQFEWLAWIPGFPIQERLNMLNAGLLLALMAVPTIFTLSEDALNNIPRSYTEASLALGASKFQTVVMVIVPAAISGVLAASLLGFGRVIGETMVVLLVAGNKIALPDFGEGLGVLTQPTHTMTGIIAQEMGEVSNGTIHYRALFVVGLVLFSISLLINYLSQNVIRKYKHSA